PQEVTPRRPAVAGPGPAAVEILEVPVRREVAKGSRPRRRVEVTANDDPLAEAGPSCSGKRVEVSDMNRAGERRMDVRDDNGHSFSRHAQPRNHRRGPAGGKPGDTRGEQGNSAVDADPVRIVASLHDARSVPVQLGTEMP